MQLPAARLPNRAPPWKPQRPRRSVAQAGLAEARSRHAAAESARARLAAEARALAEVLGVKDSERWPPMVDALRVPAGLEAALGAALGEELSSAADRAAARHWRELPPLANPPPLPATATPLAGLDGAPSGIPSGAPGRPRLGLSGRSR